MRAAGPRVAHAAARMEVRRARRAGARDHGGGGGAHRRGLSRRPHRHRGRQPGGRSARGGSASGVRRSRWTTRRSTRRDAAASHVARNTGLLQRGVQRRRQPAHRRCARSPTEYPLRGKVHGVRRALRCAEACAAEFRRAARCGRIRGSRRRSARPWARELNIGASTFRVSRILISRPDQGATFLELAPSLHDERGGPRVHAAHPARAAACARAAVRRTARARSHAFKEWLESEQESPTREIEDVERFRAADQVGHRSLGALPEHREPGRGAVVRDRRGHGGAALRSSAPRLRRAAEDARARRAPSRSR